MSFYNHLQNVLINNTGTYNTDTGLVIDKDTIPTSAVPANKFRLAAGEWSVIRPDMTENPNFIAEDRYLYLATYNNDNGADGYRLSLPIFKDYIRNFWYRTYEAPTAFQVVINFTPIVTTVLPTLSYGLSIIRTHNNEIWKMPRMYQVTGVNSVATLITALANAINNDPSPSGFVNAVPAATTLTITSRDLNDHLGFNVEELENLPGVKINSTYTPGTTGFGTYREVSYMEHYNQIQELGDLNQVLLPKKTIPEYASNLVQYGCISIEHDRPHHSIVQPKESRELIQTTFWMPTGVVAANTAILETVTGRTAYNWASLYGPAVNP